VRRTRNTSVAGVLRVGRRRHRAATALVAALALLALVLASRSADDTSAAWNDNATLAVSLTAGTWSGGSGPVYPGADTTQFSTTITWDLKNATSGQQACFTANVTTASTTPVVWKVDLDLSQPPFNGVTGGFRLAGNNGWKYQLAYNTPVQGIAEITGKPDANEPWVTVVAGQTRVVEVCNDNLPGAVQTPTAYSVSSAHGTWTDSRACIDTTITGNGTSQFYFAWQTTVDMSTAVARLAAAGHATNQWQYANNDWMTSHNTPATTASPPTFNVVSAIASNLVGTGSFTFEICAVFNG
jgi:hypothetical protein